MPHDEMGQIINEPADTPQNFETSGGGLYHGMAPQTQPDWQSEKSFQEDQEKKEAEDKELETIDKIGNIQTFWEDQNVQMSPQNEGESTDEYYQRLQKETQVQFYPERITPEVKEPVQQEIKKTKVSPDSIKGNYPQPNKPKEQPRVIHPKPISNSHQLERAIITGNPQPDKTENGKLIFNTGGSDDKGNLNNGVRITIEDPKNTTNVLTNPNALTNQKSVDFYRNQERLEPGTYVPSNEDIVLGREKALGEQKQIAQQNVIDSTLSDIETTHKDPDHIGRITSELKKLPQLPKKIDISDRDIRNQQGPDNVINGQAPANPSQIKSGVDLRKELLENIPRTKSTFNSSDYNQAPLPFSKDPNNKDDYIKLTPDNEIPEKDNDEFGFSEKQKEMFNELMQQQLHLQTLEKLIEEARNDKSTAPEHLTFLLSKKFQYEQAVAAQIIEINNLSLSENAKYGDSSPETPPDIPPTPEEPTSEEIKALQEKVRSQEEKINSHEARIEELETLATLLREKGGDSETIASVLERLEELEIEYYILKADYTVLARELANHTHSGTDDDDDITTPPADEDSEEDDDDNPSGQPPFLPDLDGAAEETALNYTPTPEQPVLSPDELWRQYNEQMLALQDIAQNRALTDAEKARYFDLQMARNQIDGVRNEEKEKDRKKRRRREIVIGVLAGIGGGALALATPPVGAAALIAVSAGGSIAAPLMRKGANKIRNKTEQMKLQDRRGMEQPERDKLDKKIERREKWANILSGVAAAVQGGAIGFGLGSLAQNIFGIGKQAATTVRTNAPNEMPRTRVPNPQPNTPPVNTPPTIGGPEAFDPNSLGNWFDISKYGWNADKLGFTGTNFDIGPVGQAASEYGPMQRDFISSIFQNGITDPMLKSPEAGNIFATYLRQAYNGGDAVQLGQQAATEIAKLAH